MGFLVAAAARLAAGVGGASALAVVWTFVRQLLTWGAVGFVGWKLEKAGTIDATAAAATEIAHTTGGAAKAVGSATNVLNDTPSIAILVGGAALLFIVMRR